MNVDCPLQVLALRRLIHILVVDPAKTVARDLPVRRPHRGYRFRVAFERHRNTKDRHGQVALCEQPVQPPEACPRPILVNRLHVHVSRIGYWRGTDDFGEKGFRCLIAVQDTILGPFLVIDDELYSDPRATRPAGIGQVGPVAAKISRVVGHFSPPPERNQRSRSSRSSSRIPVRLPTGIARVSTACW